MKKCDNCGKKFRGINQEFCTKCGTKLQEVENSKCNGKYIIIIAIILVIVCVACIALMTQSPKSCGDDLSWELNNGVLSVNGYGEMENINDGIAWDEKREEIETVLISDGVTSIGGKAFENCSNLEKAELGNSITDICEDAFKNCNRLKELSIPESVTFIATGAFEDCDNLKDIYYEGSEVQWNLLHCEGSEMTEIHFALQDEVEYIEEDLPSYEEKEPLDTTNTFIGTIGGKEVVGYLDTTDVYYFDDEKDYDATFVILNDENKIDSCIFITVYEGTSTGSYNEGSSQSFVKYYAGIKDSTLKWTDGFTFYTSTKGWNVELDEVDYSNSGRFSGSINGVLMPSNFNSSPSASEIEISGEFNFTMKGMHSVMDKYRSEHSDYCDAHQIDYIQSVDGSFGGGSNDDIDSDSSSSSKTTKSGSSQCVYCHGSGKCNACGGQGIYLASGYGSDVWVKCSICGGRETCVHCGGDGEK